MVLPELVLLLGAGCGMGRRQRVFMRHCQREVFKYENNPAIEGIENSVDRWFDMSAGGALKVRIFDDFEPGFWTANNAALRRIQDRSVRHLFSEYYHKDRQSC